MPYSEPCDVPATDELCTMATDFVQAAHSRGDQVAVRANGITANGLGGYETLLSIICKPTGAEATIGCFMWTKEGGKRRLTLTPSAIRRDNVANGRHQRLWYFDDGNLCDLNLVAKQTTLAARVQNRLFDE